MKSLKTANSASPYAVSSLIGFSVLNGLNGTIESVGIMDGAWIRLHVAVGSMDVKTVNVYVDGLKVDRVDVKDGSVEVSIKPEKLMAVTRDKEYDCISVVGLGIDGSILARNYLLTKTIYWNDLSMSGDEDVISGIVPSIPGTWIKEVLAPVYPAVLDLSGQELRQLLRMIPSPFGKSTPLWFDYVAGTDPRPNSLNGAFRTYIDLNGTLPRITWAPDLGEMRKYSVYGTKSLWTQDWHTPPEADDHFFKVVVELP